MFEKRLVELISLFLYLTLTAPIIYSCRDDQFLKWDGGNILDSISQYGLFAICLLVGYVLFFRLFIFIYMALSLWHIKMSYELDMKNKELEAKYGKKWRGKAISRKNAEVEDHRKKRRSPSLKKKAGFEESAYIAEIESVLSSIQSKIDLAGIHIKHEKRRLR